MPFKITLDHKALELLMKDEQFALDIRDAILKLVMGRHIKTFVSSETIKAWDNRISEIVNEVVRENFGKVDWNERFTSSSKFTEGLKKAKESIVMQDWAADLFQQRVQEYVDTGWIKETIKLTIERKVTNMLLDQRNWILEYIKSQLTDEWIAELKAKILASIDLDKKE